MESEDKSPIWARYAPFVVAIGYYFFGRFYLKEKPAKAIFWSLMLGFAASVPWFVYNKKGKMPAILSSASTSSASSIIDAKVPGSANLNAMNKAGRQEAISYLISQVKNQSSEIGLKVEPKPDAYQTLTNDELKALYLVTKFIQDKEELKKYGTVTDDALAKKIAKDKYGIDVDSIKNLKEAATVAIVKIGNYYLKNPA